MTLINTFPLEEEFKKNPELKKADIEYIREWMTKQPHLPKVTDSEIVLFLHSNYYSLERTKATIEQYYTLRTHVPEFFSARDPIGCKDVRNVFTTAFHLPLATKTKEGYQIMTCKLIDTNPSHFVYNDSMKVFTMSQDLHLTTEGTQIGNILILDMAGVTIAHTTRLSPLGIKKFLVYLQEAMPIRLKGLHFINSVPAMDIILGMMKPFMKKELLDLLHIHTNLDTLAKFVPIEALPNEQGGKGGASADLHAANVKRMEEHRAWYQEEEATRRVNESLRVGKAKNATDLFGVEGSFKKLEID